MKKEILRNRYRVALYPRVSSHEQVDGYSIGEQIERLTKYCEAMDWDIFKIYTDPGYSGGSLERPGLQTMLADVRDGLVDKVVVYKLDRLSRSQKDTMMLIEDEFLAHGVDFVSMSENFDTSTSFGRAMIGILAVFAQLERENIKERTKMGKEARAKEGKWGGGSSDPVGYNYNPATEELVVNEYEKMQVLEVVDLFLKGTPYRTIADIMRDKGYSYVVRPGVVSFWEPKRIKYVLKSKLYIGYIRYGGEWFKGDHEPILDEETFEKVQEIIKLRDQEYDSKHSRKKVQTSILGGFVYCKRCGARYAKMSGVNSKTTTKPHYYACYSRSKKVPKMVKDPTCKNKTWRMNDLDAIVLGEIKKLSLDPHYISEIRHEKNNSSEIKNKIDIIEEQLKMIDDQISRFMDLYGLGTFTIEQVSEKINPLNERKKALEKELSTLNADSNIMDDEEVIAIATSLEDVLARGDLNEIRLVVESLIYYVELDEDDVYIHWRFL